MQEQIAADAATGEVSLDFDAMTNEQFETWRETGEMPKPEQSGEQDPSAAAEKQPESAETSDSSDEEQDENAEEEQPKKKSGGFQRRIDKLTREKNELASRLAAVEGRLAGDPAATPKEQPQAKASERPTKPDASKFNSYSELEAAQEEYVEQLAEWKAKEAVRAARAEDQRTQTERQARERAEATMSGWQERVAAAAEKYSDFAEVTSRDIEITPAMQQAIVESELGADVAYHLGKHPEEAERIAGLSPLAQARELGKIEAQISTAKTPTPKAKASKAPAPLTPVAGGKSAVNVNDEKVSYRDWEKQREAQLRARRR